MKTAWEAWAPRCTRVKAEVLDAHLTWQSFGRSLNLNFPTCNTLFAFFMNFTLPPILDLKLVHVNRISVILWPNRGRGRFKLVLFAQRLFPHNLAQDEADSWLGRGCSSSTQPGNTWLRSCRSTELNKSQPNTVQNAPMPPSWTAVSFMWFCSEAVCGTQDTPGFPGGSGVASADASVVSSGVSSPVKAKFKWRATRLERKTFWSERQKKMDKPCNCQTTFQTHARLHFWTVKSPSKLAVSDLEPTRLASLSLHMLLHMPGRRDVALDIGGRGALWGALDRAGTHSVSAMVSVSRHQIRRKFGTSKCAKTPLTARRPKTKVPQVEALMAFFFLGPLQILT